jgi:5-oxoprolinase (ATP-hydrolysing)
MGLADLRTLRERAVEQPLGNALLDELDPVLAELGADGTAEMRAQRIEPSRISLNRKVHLRYEGSDTPLMVDFGSLAEVIDGFEAAHRQRYGFVMPGKGHIVEAVSVEVVGATEAVEDPVLDKAPRTTPLELRARGQLYAEDRWQDTPVFERVDLLPGDLIDGPAVIIEPTSTTVVEPGWRAELSDRDHLVLTRVRPLERTAAVGTDVDPVMLEIFNNLFMSIAEQMGSTLEKTAYSVNIKERLDFSCALFTPEGNLVANAPHMPVHLGSMSESVRAIIRDRRGAMAPGDVYMLNAPYNGGTHLPDITVITPVFNGGGGDGSGGGDDILFFVGSRGHHADVGGITPGSMPPDSRTVEEEGVLIDNFTLVERGRFCEQETLDLLASGAYPARNPKQNMADLQAQIAANEKGVQELRKMVAHFGLDVVHAYMKQIGRASCRERV